MPLGKGTDHTCNELDSSRQNNAMKCICWPRRRQNIGGCFASSSASCSGRFGPYRQRFTDKPRRPMAKDVRHKPHYSYKASAEAALPRVQGEDTLSFT